MPKQTVLTVRVRLVLPAGVNAPQAQQYIREAIRTHCGGLDPEDPMFDLERDSVTVALQSKTVEYGRAPKRPPPAPRPANVHDIKGKT